MPEEARKVHDTSERGGLFEPFRTDSKNDAIQIHTDGEMSQGEKSELSIRRSNRNVNKPNTVASHIEENSGCD